MSKSQRFFSLVFRIGFSSKIYHKSFGLHKKSPGGLWVGIYTNGFGNMTKMPDDHHAHIW